MVLLENVHKLCWKLLRQVGIAIRNMSNEVNELKQRYDGCVIGYRWGLHIDFPVMRILIELVGEFIAI